MQAPRRHGLNWVVGGTHMRCAARSAMCVCMCVATYSWQRLWFRPWLGGLRWTFGCLVGAEAALRYRGRSGFVPRVLWFLSVMMGDVDEKASEPKAAYSSLPSPLLKGQALYFICFIRQRLRIRL